MRRTIKNPRYTMRYLLGCLISMGVIAQPVIDIGGTSRAAAQNSSQNREELPRLRRQEMESAFQLFRDRDLAFADLRLAGDFDGCTENSGFVTWSCWWLNHPNWWVPDFFRITFYVAAPDSERNKHATAVPSLANARGKGYTVNSQQSAYAGETLPHDGTLGPHHSGVASLQDGSCRQTAILDPGLTLQAFSDCPPTWGSLGWQGSHLVDEDGFVRYADRVGGSAFSFDPWRVPEDLQRTDRFLGSFQTYGFFSDYSAETLFGSGAFFSYGNVIPESMGGDPTEEPSRSGWPLGILVKEDAFSFAAPGLLNTAWYQFTITNNSAEVYGVGLDYDSLYLGWQVGWWTLGENTSQYRDPANNVFRAAVYCQTVGCNGREDPKHAISPWEAEGNGLAYGVGAIIVLKSPIGDLRNKLFSDPSSGFFGMGDPQSWDDTITFSHGHMCGFHSCSRETWDASGSTAFNSDYEQRQFGMVASITRDALGDRDLLGFDDHTAWDSWRWEDYPDRTQLDFNKWVPGGWDYDEDGVPDTLYYDDCSGDEGPQFDPITESTKNCAVTFSDTLPGGLGNTYSNRGAVTGVGPIALQAGETTQMLFAIVMADNFTDSQNDIAAAVDHYMSFFLGPEPAPAPAIVSLDVQHGGGSAGPDSNTQPASSVTLYWDDQAAQWNDPWLARFLDNLQAADPASELGRIRQLNPWLADTVAALIPDNVEAIYIFKSCDSGGGFTSDSDCIDDPATGEGSKFTGLGWQPWVTLEPDASGSFGNTIVDDDIFGGRSFLYSMVTETRGLTVPVLTGEVLDTAGTGEVSCIQGCGAIELEVAPKIIPAISKSTSDPNVVDVYVPIAREAGSKGASIELTAGSPDHVPFERMNVTATSAEVGDGEYRLSFGDPVVVTQVAIDGTVTSTEVVVAAAADTDTYRAAGQVALSTADPVETVSGDTVTSVYTFDGTTSVLVNGNDVPLVVSDVLDGEGTIPGSYFGLPSYPHFIYRVDNSLAGEFDTQTYLDPSDREIGPLVQPSVTWRHSIADGLNIEGRYRVSWSAPAFGAASPFTIDLADPVATRAMVLSSLAGRESVMSSTDPDVLSFLGLTSEAVLSVELPFTIENITSGAATPVTVVVPADGKNTSLLLGSGLDTLIVQTPETEWLPGDRLILVEGGAANGFTATVGSAFLGCDPSMWLRLGCNPVAIGSRGATGYIENAAGQKLPFSYYQTITNETSYTFDVSSAIRGDDIIAANDVNRIRASLDSVKVVPNPFVMFSQYSTSGDEDRVIFTHVPPNGVLRIYTVSGQFVQQIRWGPNDLNGNGDLWFNLRTREGNEMAAGLYLFVLIAKDLDGNEIGTAKGKFVIIR